MPRSSSGWGSACSSPSPTRCSAPWPARKGSPAEHDLFLENARMTINLTLIAQAFTFAIFLLFAAKFIWPYFTRKIDERQKTIADGLAAGERGKQELEAAGKRAGEELASARDRVGEIIASAEKRDVQMLEEA